MVEALTGAVILAWIVIVLQCFALAGILRILRVEQAHGTGGRLLVGMGLPDAGRLSALLSRLEGPALVLFADRGCNACEDLLLAVEDNVSEELGVQVVVLARHKDAIPVGLPKHATAVVSPEAFASLHVTATPFFVLTDSEGRVHDFGAALDASAIIGAAAALAAANNKDHASEIANDDSVFARKD